MRNFQIKSILLGIGIGIVITSIISMIYAAGINPNKSLSREEIISKAKEFGMVESILVLNNQNSTTKEVNASSDEKVDSSNEKSITKNEDTKQENSESKNTTENTKDVEKLAELNISINQGDTSEVVASRLQEKGLINHKNDFIEKLTELGLSSEINVGEFKIKEGSSMEEIIKIVTGTK